MYVFKLYTFVSGLFALTSVFWIFHPVKFQDFKRNISTPIYSNEGFFLGQTTNQNSTRNEWKSLKEFPKYLTETVIAAEDKRFFEHKGMDIFAFFSVIKSLVFREGSMRGASTITMQLARIHFPYLKNQSNLVRKILECIIALRIEFWLSKEEILEAYLNSVSIRSNIVGFPSAGKFYFQKNIRFLSKEEGIALTVLLRENHPTQEKFVSRYNSLKKKMQTSGVLDSDTGYESIELYKSEDKKLNLILIALGFQTNEEEVSRQSQSIETKHFLTWIRSILPGQLDEFTSELSSEFNFHLHSIVNSELIGLRKWNVGNASLLVFQRDRKDKEVIHLVGMIGSKNFYEDGDGQVNGTLAYRDAGSTLKPLLYALGIEKNLFQANTILEDERKIYTDSDGNSYLPRNADLGFWGKMTLAEALANSRNIPAVTAVSKISVGEFLQFLHLAGFEHLKSTPKFYGPGLSLGSGGASLFQLTRAYASFISGGVLPIVELGKNLNKSITYGTKQKLFSSQVAEEIKYILSDRNLRSKAFGKRSYLDFPYSIAIKTGTSKDYRNSWAIGFNEEYIVGAWVGNFSGEKTMDVSGSFGAGRIVQNTFRFLVGKDRKPTLEYKLTTLRSICKISGKESNANCNSISLRIGSNRKILPCDGHGNLQSRFLSPSQGQIFLLHPGIELSKQEIPIRIQGNLSNTKVVWNEKKKLVIPNSGEIRLPIVRGKHRLELIKDGKIESTVNFEVQ